MDLELLDPAEALRRKRWELVRKNPWVPLGALATAGILGTGLMHFRRGNREASQRFMRYRIIAQGVTAVLAGLSLAPWRRNPEEVGIAEASFMESEK